MSERKSPAFSIYPKDWLASEDITLMPPEAEGLFVRLLMIAWDNHGLPTEPDAVKKLAGTKYARVWKTAWPPVRRKFVERSGRLINKRQEVERDKQAERRQKAVGAAKSRWDNDRGDANASTKHMQEAYSVVKPEQSLAFAVAVAGESKTTTVPDGTAQDNVYRQIFPLIREHLWKPDGVCPVEIAGKSWTEAQEGTVIRELHKAYSVSDLEVIVLGLGTMLRGMAEAERPEWLPVGAKASLRAVYHTRSGVVQMVERCRRAYWAVENKRPKKPSKDVGITDAITRVVGKIA